MGAPGCGKSALLAQVGEVASAELYLLALKTDQLPRSIESLLSLDQHLGLKSPLVASVREVASHEPVVLLIDQLDALGSLMDLHTQRLDVILKVIHWLKGAENVHILISCREFEFQYDARFRALHAEEQVLTDPPWEAVRGLLECEGVSALGWPHEMMQHTENTAAPQLFFGRCFQRSKTPVFTSYQAMLDEVFTHRVQRFQASAQKLSRFARIASEMSESEELWIPWSAFDSDYGEEIDRLVGAGILKRKA